MSGTASEALRAVYENAAHPMPFAAEARLTGTAELELRGVNPVAAILGRGGIVEAFGGELLRDNFSVALLPSIGADRGFQARYGKNLTGLDFEENVEGVVTRIKPAARTSENEPLYLPELYVDSPNIGAYFMPKFAAVEFSDLKVDVDGLTEEAVFEEMRARARKIFEGGADLPAINAKVNFVLLSQTVNFAEYEPLEDIRLGDVVSVIHDGMGVSLKTKCVKYIYDCVRRKYSRIELGQPRPDFGGVITDRAVGAAAVTGTALTAHLGDANAHFTPEEKEWIRKQAGLRA